MNWLPLAVLFFLFQRRQTAAADKASKPDLTKSTGPKSGGPGSTGVAAWKNGSRSTPPTVMYMTNQLTDWWVSFKKFERIWDAINPESFIPIIPAAWGTDREALLTAIKSLNTEERKYLCRGYPFWYWDSADTWWRPTGHTLVWSIEDDLDDEDKAIAKQSLSCIQV